MAPELAYVTARYAALAPFDEVADPAVGAANQRGGERGHGAQQKPCEVGEAVVQPENVTTTEKPAGPVVVGLDGGYVRSQHRQ